MGLEKIKCKDSLNAVKNSFLLAIITENNNFVYRVVIMSLKIVPCPGLLTLLF